MGVVTVKFKDSEGSVTIEATISLTAFIFTIITILTTANICLVQSKIATALNLTAKEISEYTYFYSITGLNESNANLSRSAEGTKNNITKTVENVNAVFNSISNISNGVQNVDITDPGSISGTWSEIEGNIDTITQSASEIEEMVSDVLSDPKSFLLGMSKLLASEGYELVKSNLIAAPLSKALIKKHLKSFKGDDAENFLRRLHVVPAPNGSYVDGLDFRDSKLFPYGSNEIRIVVKYKVRVIPLLPIKKEFYFTQTAVTHGWFGGNLTYKPVEQAMEEAAEEAAEEKVENPESIWTTAPINERASFIRHMGIRDYKDMGYLQTKGLTDVPLYNPETNNFVMISSMNPLYSTDSKQIKVEDLDEAVLRESLNNLVGKMLSTTSGLNQVKVAGPNGVETKNCANATNTIVLVVPEDPGLKEKIESVISNMNTRGVNIEVNASFGLGTRVETNEDKSE